MKFFEDSLIVEEKKLPIGTFKLIPLIETSGAIVNIKDICTACTRVIAVAFGCEDYVTDFHIIFVIYLSSFNSLLLE